MGILFHRTIGIFALFVMFFTSACDEPAPNNNGEAEAVIGANGGTVSHPGGASVEIPAGALTENTTISVRTLTDDNISELCPEIIHYYGGADFGTDGTTFIQPVTITFPLVRSLPSGVEVPLYIYDEENSASVETEFTAIVSEDGQSARAEVTHFTTFLIVMPIEARILARVEDFIGDGADFDVSLTNYTSWFIETIDPFEFWTLLHGCCYTFVGVNVSLLYFLDGQEYAGVRPIGEQTSVSQRLYFASEYTHGEHQINYEITVDLFIGVEPTLTLNASERDIEVDDTSTVTAELSCQGEAMTGNTLTFEVDPLGSLTSTTETTGSDGKAQTTFLALDEGTSTVSVNHDTAHCVGDQASFGMNETINIGEEGELWRGHFEGDFAGCHGILCIDNGHVEIDFLLYVHFEDDFCLGEEGTSRQTIGRIYSEEPDSQWVENATTPAQFDAPELAGAALYPPTDPSTRTIPLSFSAFTEYFSSWDLCGQGFDGIKCMEMNLNTINSGLAEGGIPVQLEGEKVTQSGEFRIWGLATGEGYAGHYELEMIRE